MNPYQYYPYGSQNYPQQSNQNQYLNYSFNPNYTPYPQQMPTQSYGVYDFQNQPSYNQSVFKGYIPQQNPLPIINNQPNQSTFGQYPGKIQDNNQQTPKPTSTETNIQSTAEKKTVIANPNNAPQGNASIPQKSLQQNQANQAPNPNIPYNNMQIPSNQVQMNYNNQYPKLGPGQPQAYINPYQNVNPTTNPYTNPYLSTQQKNLEQIQNSGGINVLPKTKINSNNIQAQGPTKANPNIQINQPSQAGVSYPQYQMNINPSFTNPNMPKSNFYPSGYPYPQNHLPNYSIYPGTQYPSNIFLQQPNTFYPQPQPQLQANYVQPKQNISNNPPQWINIGIPFPSQQQTQLGMNYQQNLNSQQQSMLEPDQIKHPETEISSNTNRIEQANLSSEIKLNDIQQPQIVSNNELNLPSKIDPQINESTVDVNNIEIKLDHKDSKEETIPNPFNNPSNLVDSIKSRGLMELSLTELLEKILNLDENKYNRLEGEEIVSCISFSNKEAFINDMPNVNNLTNICNNNGSNQQESSDLYGKVLASLELFGVKLQDDKFVTDITSFIGKNNIDQYTNYANITWNRIDDIFGSDNWEIFKELPILSTTTIIQATEQNSKFIAILYALMTKSSIIENAFISKKRNKFGAYCLNLYENGVLKEIVIDDYLPCNQETKKYNFILGKDNQLWPSIAEKALAKISGSYSNLYNEYSNNIFSIFTGAPCITYMLKDITDLNTIWDQIQENCGIIMTCKSADINLGDVGLPTNSYFAIISCYDIDVPSLDFESAQNQDFSVKNKENIELIESSPQDLQLSEEKLNSLAKSENSKIRLLKLKDPLNLTKWKGKWSSHYNGWNKQYISHLKPNTDNDGTFFIEWFDFVKYFLEIYICYWKKENTQTNQEYSIPYNHSLQFQFTVEKEGNYGFTVHQQLSNYIISKFSNINMILAEMNDISNTQKSSEILELVPTNNVSSCKSDSLNQYHLLKGILQNNKIVSIYHNLKPGKYHLYIKIPWNDNQTHDFRLSIFGPSILNMNQVDPNIISSKTFLQSILLDKAKSSHNICNYGNYRQSSSIKVIEINENIGWGYIYFNNQSDCQMNSTIQFNEFNGIKFSKPNQIINHTLILNECIESFQEFLAIIKIIDKSNIKYTYTETVKFIITQQELVRLAKIKGEKRKKYDPWIGTQLDINAYFYKYNDGIIIIYENLTIDYILEERIDLTSSENLDLEEQPIREFILKPNENYILIIKRLEEDNNTIQHNLKCKFSTSLHKLLNNDTIDLFCI